jgi:hypothetical protein
MTTKLKQGMVMKTDELFLALAVMFMMTRMTEMLLMPMYCNIIVLMVLVNGMEMFRRGKRCRWMLARRADPPHCQIHGGGAAEILRHPSRMTSLAPSVRGLSSEARTISRGH